jgi:hypothetical protein
MTTQFRQIRHIRKKCDEKYASMSDIEKFKLRYIINVEDNRRCKELKLPFNERSVGLRTQYNMSHPVDEYDYFLLYCELNNICWQCGRTEDKTDQLFKLHKRMCIKCYNKYIEECDRDLEEYYEQ